MATPPTAAKYFLDLSLEKFFVTFTDIFVAIICWAAVICGTIYLCASFAGVWAFRGKSWIYFPIGALLTGGVTGGFYASFIGIFVAFTYSLTGSVMNTFFALAWGLIVSGYVCFSTGLAPAASNAIRSSRRWDLEVIEIFRLIETRIFFGNCD
ncbi:hypothetical protein PAPYR_9562 [Paratrimastix pyriformis]|uniref:Uncharacterized protein n=1 Tax=Paratrimastix pyriformis TaxID=342808 RepID=A0ABQ8UAU5_9EUKA|nr:hypothetical protein PAPYR_9562 [Paratrimastix pyriformis]